MSQTSNAGGTSLIQRIHPLGWAALAFIVVAALLTLFADGYVIGLYLMGNLTWWQWLAAFAVLGLSFQPAALKALSAAIDRIADFTGGMAWRLAWLVFFFSLFNVVTRYVARYVEKDIIIGEVGSLAWMSFALIYLLGVNYGIKNGVNPRIDFWWAEFSNLRKAWLDFVLHVTLMLPFLVMASRVLYSYATDSLGQRRDGTWPSGWKLWETWEKSPDAGNLAVGPIQAMIFVGTLLFTIQIFSEAIKSGFVIMGREDLAGIDDNDAPIRIE